MPFIIIKSPLRTVFTPNTRKTDGAIMESLVPFQYAYGMTNRRITEQRIENALRVVACVIDHYGEVYWPVFERLERELADKRKRDSALSRYLPTPRKARAKGHRKAPGRRDGLS